MNEKKTMQWSKTMIYHDALPISEICKWLPGKADPANKDVWLPSWQHMLDTALVIRKLYRNWLPDAERRIIQTDIGDDNAHSRRRKHIFLCNSAH